MFIVLFLFCLPLAGWRRALEGASGSSVGLKNERIAFLNGTVRSSGWAGKMGNRNGRDTRLGTPPGWRLSQSGSVARDARPYRVITGHCNAGNILTVQNMQSLAVKRGARFHTEPQRHRGLENDLKMGFHPMPRIPANRKRLTGVRGLGRCPRQKYKSPSVSLCLCVRFPREDCV